MAPRTQRLGVTVDADGGVGVERGATWRRVEHAATLSDDVSQRCVDDRRRVSRQRRLVLHADITQHATVYNPRWVQHRCSYRSGHISRQKYDLDHQGHPRSNLCQSKAHRHFPIWSLLSPTQYLSPFGHKSTAWPPNQPTKDMATTCVAIGPVCNTMYCSLDRKIRGDYVWHVYSSTVQASENTVLYYIKQYMVNSRKLPNIIVKPSIVETERVRQRERDRQTDRHSAKPLTVIRLCPVPDHLELSSPCQVLTNALAVWLLKSTRRSPVTFIPPFSWKLSDVSPKPCKHFRLLSLLQRKAIMCSVYS